MKYEENGTNPKLLGGLKGVVIRLGDFRKNPLILKSSFIIFVTLVIYWQDLVLLINEALFNEISSHILAIPFMFTYLVYRKRKIFVVTIVKPALFIS